MEDHQQRDGEHQQPARRVQPHHQVATVFAIDDHAGERHQQHRRDRLQHDQQAQRHLGMGLLQDRPVERGAIHAAAHHRNQVRKKYEPHTALLEDLAHFGCAPSLEALSILAAISRK